MLVSVLFDLFEYNMIFTMFKKLLLLQLLLLLLSLLQLAITVVSYYSNKLEKV